MDIRKGKVSVMKKYEMDNNDNIYKGNFKENENNRNLKKEKLSIIAASAFVLTALTLTGVYMSATSRHDNENSIDFAKLQENQNIKSEEMAEDSRFTGGNAKADIPLKSEEDGFVDKRFVAKEMYDLSDNNDMDVDPAYTQANSSEISNDIGNAIKKEDKNDTDAKLEGTDKAAVFMAEEAQNSKITFSESDTLKWPVNGNIIMEYNMEKAVYHPTMQQYRYNPSIIIGAEQGEAIVAATDGRVKDIYDNSQTGKTIVFDIGNGYELTYGQLEDVNLAKGDFVKAGDIVGKVAAPTIYYSEEGSNVYFKLTKDGMPINPMDRLK